MHSVFARDGMVVTAHPAASQAGVRILEDGGNAVDAAIAISAVLCVVEPCHSQLGGDGFFLVRSPDDGVVALNGCGGAPSASSAAGFPYGLPARGPAACTVPGLVGAWRTLSNSFGSRTWDKLLAPAFRHAHEGVPVTKGLEQRIRLCEPFLGEEVRATFVPNGHVPTSGTIISQLELASTLAELSDKGPDDFYEGSIAEAIDQWSADSGGLIRLSDLQNYSVEFEEPISVTYKGHMVFGQPPPSKAHVLLEALNIIEDMEVAPDRSETWESWNACIEAYRLALDDGTEYVGDPRFVLVPLERLLSKAYAKTLRGERSVLGLFTDKRGDTSSFVVGDRNGMLVSAIQSIFDFFGACTLVGSTGILMNNRLSTFSLDPESPNVIAPRKRPWHTLHSYILKDADSYVVGGTPGQDTQASTNLQIIMNLVDHGMSVAEAVSSPRWWFDPELLIEDRVDPDLIEGLRRVGNHDFTIAKPWSARGRAQVLRYSSGVYEGASDPRWDGAAIGI